MTSCRTRSRIPTTSSSFVGLEVEEEGGRRLGTVAEVHNGPANDSIELDSGLLLPLVAACITAVDLEAGRVIVSSGFANDE